MQLKAKIVLGLALASGGFIRGETPADTPRPIPLTRPELKQLIESVKVREPRIPLPELTDQERETLGNQSNSYESRLRSTYLSGIEGSRGAGGPGRNGQSGERLAAGTGRAGRGGGLGQPQDPNMTLDNAFKVELFWIVSRVNNCQYCLGHQESKLLGAGLSEDRIAALDGDWLMFSPAERVAYAFARKFTLEPHLLSDADIVSLKKHYSDAQILEMCLSMAGNNSINRWKEGVGVPQNPDEGGYSRMARLGQPEQAVQPNAPQLPSGTYLTPTSVAFEKLVTRVAPVVIDKNTGKPTSATVSNRPALEPREQVEKMLAMARQRASRLPLVDEASVRSTMPEAAAIVGPLPNWVRLVGNFPRSAARNITTVLSADANGDLSPLLKAQMSWIIARQDRAWYITGQAQKRLRELGQSDDQIYALDGDWKGFTPREQALFVVAKKLGASPVVLTDSEVANAVKLAGPRDVVQAINYTTTRASLNRITEAAGLPIEP